MQVSHQFHRWMMRCRIWLIAWSLCLFHLSVLAATSPTNATVRVPQNIRVVATNGTIAYVPLETYVARVLHQEWYSTWTNYSGGLNSLKSGAVAIRAYVIAKLNNVTTNSTYDICDTTSCQVYRTSSSHHTVIAANSTAGYVVTTASFNIPSTEYSAENNSLGFACGDGYTAPTGSCLYDPVCSGETRFGHGRGLCQWGSAKWATGLKMSGNGANYPSNAQSGLTNGQPKQTWDWIINHYYPDYLLLEGKPLVQGDDIKTSIAIQVRMNADGSISNLTGKGMSAPFVVTKAANSSGVIMTNSSNGILVTNDNFGFTWYKIQWSDGTVGWSPENWLQRVVPAPAAPFNLTATTISTTQINLAWSDTNSMELGFQIERSPLTNGNWSQIDTVAANVAAYADTNVFASTKYYYRIRAYNAGGNSSYSNTTNATTPGIAPSLPTISNKTVVEGTLLTFTNTATAPDVEQSLTDFESYSAGNAVMFRTPNVSGSTSGFLDSSSANVAALTSSFPAGTNHDALALNVNWTFTNVANPWLRLTTSSNSAVSLPNPVIDFTKKLKFDIYSDKALRVALGCRETTVAAGTPIGSNGGGTGAIEWAGATNALGTGPAPNHTVTASTWTTLSFNLPTEPALNFSGGNGVLSTASGLGVLEHLAFVPGAGAGAYNVYLDNFIVATPKTLTYSLSNAPSGATINTNTGVFTWIPSEGQGPGSYTMTVRVTDNGTPPQSDAKTFTVTVTETNAAPVLATIANYTVHAGNMLVITNSATDSDLPANALSFSLTNAPAGAAINSSNGRFTWTPLDAQANTNYPITAKVTDNGTPSLSNTKTFTVTVTPRPTLQGISATGGNFSFSWSAIPGKSYRVQYKDDLSAPNWINLQDITADSSTASFSETAGAAQRYYRVIDLN